MWIYWKERCNYCVNRENCKYKEKVLELMDIFALKIMYMEHLIGNVIISFLMMMNI